MIHPKEFIVVDCDPENSAALLKSVGLGNPRCVYHGTHILYEHDRLFELSDSGKSEVIFCY